MRRLRCVCCAMTRVAALYLTSACHAQGSNQISRFDGVVFPAGLTKLHLVSIWLLQAFVLRFEDVMCAAVAVCVCCAITRVAALYLTSACHAQHGNKISSLDGVVFPAGLTTLWLVSFCDCRHLFRGVWM